LNNLIIFSYKACWWPFRTATCSFC